MADLSEYWRKHEAVLTSGAEQARAEAMRLVQELVQSVEDDDKGFAAVQGIIDQFRDDERLGIAMLGHLAEVGLIHCLLAEFD